MIDVLCRQNMFWCTDNNPFNVCIARMCFATPTFTESNKAHLIACRCKAHRQHLPLNHANVAWQNLSQQQSYEKNSVDIGMAVLKMEVVDD